MPGKKKVWLVRLKIFLALFILLEIILRLFGMEPGSSLNNFKVEDNPVYQARFISDESGINHLVPNAQNLMDGTIVNQQGFRGSFDYTAQSVDSIRNHTKKEIIMIIGDSFAEGCCPGNVSNSFPDLLNNDPKYCVLNFGVSGADPLQYKLIAEKYVQALKPDKVIVAIYFGNDILNFERKPAPGIPYMFPFKGNRWLVSVTDNNLSLKEDYVLKTPGEAYDFFVDHYTLKGTNRNFFEKLISYSVCFSKLYLAAEYRISRRKWQHLYSKKQIINSFEITNSFLTKIKTVCDSAAVPVIFTGIPSPADAKHNETVKEKYKDVFKNLEWYTPDSITADDYDGPDIGNHFNKSGHEKYCEFLKNILDQTK